VVQPPGSERAAARHYTFALTSVTFWNELMGFHGVVIIRYSFTHYVSSNRWRLLQSTQCHIPGDSNLDITVRTANLYFSNAPSFSPDFM
jgi:hypothetical protein